MPDYGTVINNALRTDTVNSDGLPIDMEELTKVLKPRNYVTRTMTKQFGQTIVADQMEHKYRERRPIPNWTTITAVSNVGASTITVADPSYIKNDVVLWIVRDGVKQMQLLVQDTSIDSTVAVVRFTGTTGSGTLTVATAVGDIVVIGTEAHAEGEAVPTAYSNISVTQRDYLMQIDRAVKKTDIEGNVKHYDSAEKKLARDLSIAWIEEQSKLNLALYFGEETLESTSASVRRYQFQGLFDRVTEVVQDFSGGGAGFTQQSLQEVLRRTLDNAAAGGRKVLVAGVNVNNNIASWPEGSIRVSPNDRKWGVKIRRIQTQYGGIDVVYDNVMNARYGIADHAFILDSAFMRQMHLQGLKMKTYMNITGRRDIHNMEHAISGTWGVQTASLESFAHIYGVN
ncbi:MAG: SU10 major capsid protein [Planctomycetota bacterium]|jgi:hypothetical protein